MLKSLNNPTRALIELRKNAQKIFSMTANRAKGKFMVGLLVLQKSSLLWEQLLTSVRFFSITDATKMLLANSY